MNETRNGVLDRYPIEKKNTGRPSVTVKEDGTVIFYLYAPLAKKVQAAGLGGYFANEKINLLPDGQGGFLLCQGNSPWYGQHLQICFKSEQSPEGMLCLYILWI